MKKLNEKGVTLIELIVSFALVATAVIYFYQTLSTIYDLYATSKKETQEYVDKDYAMRIVDAYVNENIGKDGFDVNKICNYIGCSSVTFKGGDINIVKINKKYNNEEYVWLTYYTPKKDKVGEMIVNILDNYGADELENQLYDICSNSGLGSCDEYKIEFDSINKDIVKIKNEGKTLYTYEKTYDVEKEEEINKLAEYFAKNGTINLSNYCDDKSWCDSVGTVTSEINDKGKTTISLVRNYNTIFEQTYNQDDIVQNLVSIERNDTYGAGEVKSRFFPVFEDKNNIITAAFGQTVTSYTFDTIYKADLTKFVEVNFSLKIDPPWNNTYVENYTKIEFIDAYTGDTLSNIDLGMYPDGWLFKTTSTEWTPSSSFTWTFAKKNIVNQTKDIKVKVTVKQNGTIYNTAYTAIEINYNDYIRK